MSSPLSPSPAHLSSTLMSVLGLAAAPVALHYVREPPSSVPTDTEPVPAGCAFWRRAETGTRFTPAAAHTGCPVGMHTQGLAMDEAATAELGTLITTMGEVGYLAGVEIASIPTVDADRTGAAGGIIEGPLADTASVDDVDLVLFWADARQAMLFNEATGGAAWGGSGTTVFGRPACAVLPAAMACGRPAFSFGCAGMRTFTEVSRDQMLVAVPQAALAGLAERVEALGTANDTMDGFYAARRLA